MESVRSKLMNIRAKLDPEEWNNTRIYVHNDVEFEHFTLVATQVKSGSVHYYNPEKGEFQPLNV